MTYKLMKEHMQSPKKQEEWLNPRLTYLRKINKPLPTYCPECSGETEHTPKDEIICKDCNLVIREPIEYVGLTHVNYPYKKGVLDLK